MTGAALWAAPTMLENVGSPYFCDFFMVWLEERLLEVAEYVSVRLNHNKWNFITLTRKKFIYRKSILELGKAIHLSKYILPEGESENKLLVHIHLGKMTEKTKL